MKNMIKNKISYEDLDINFNIPHILKLCDYHSVKDELLNHCYVNYLLNTSNNVQCFYDILCNSETFSDVDLKYILKNTRCSILVRNKLEPISTLKMNGKRSFLYLNKLWKIDWGSHLHVVRDEDIVHTITCKPRRLITLEGNIEYCFSSVERICPDLNLCLQFDW